MRQLLVEVPCADPELWRRVRGEFLEMPGLRLTLAQACRLWNTDTATSLQVLDDLVDCSFLKRTGDFYVRV